MDFIIAWFEQKRDSAVVATHCCPLLKNSKKFLLSKISSSHAALPPYAPTYTHTHAYIFFSVLRLCIGIGRAANYGTRTESGNNFSYSRSPCACVLTRLSSLPSVKLSFSLSPPYIYAYSTRVYIIHIYWPFSVAADAVAPRVYIHSASRAPRDREHCVSARRRGRTSTLLCLYRRHTGDRNSRARAHTHIHVRRGDSARGSEKREREKQRYFVIGADIKGVGARPVRLRSALLPFVYSWTDTFTLSRSSCTCADVDQE